MPSCSCSSSTSTTKLADIANDNAGIALALNLGLRGLVSTIHTNSARDVLQRIEDLLHKAGGNPLRRELARTVNVVVFMTGDEAEFRRVADVQHVTGVDAASEFVLEAAA